MPPAFDEGTGTTNRPTDSAAGMCTAGAGDMDHTSSNPAASTLDKGPGDGLNAVGSTEPNSRSSSGTQGAVKQGSSSSSSSSRKLSGDELLTELKSMKQEHAELLQLVAAQMKQVGYVWLHKMALEDVSSGVYGAVISLS